jgi:hypothetical protein
MNPLEWQSMPGIRRECGAMDRVIKYREREALHRESTSEAFPMRVRLLAMEHHQMARDAHMSQSCIDSKCGLFAFDDDSGTQAETR